MFGIQYEVYSIMYNLSRVIFGLDSKVYNISYMNWQEVLRRAGVYGEEQQRKAALEEERRAQEAEQWRREEPQRRKRELVRAREVLEALQVREVLEAMRDEVWQEGDVREVEVDSPSSEFGLKLVSNRYPVLHISMDDRNEPEVSLIMGETSLNVVVLSSDGKPRTRGEVSTLRVKDQSLLNLRSTPSPSDVLKEFILRPALFIITKPFREPIRNDTLVQVDLKNLEEARNLLSATLVGHTNERIRHASFPAQIRDWSESLIDWFPPRLREEGQVGGRELRKWGHRVAGTPGPLVLFDRLLRRA